MDTANERLVTLLKSVPRDELRPLYQHYKLDSRVSVKRLVDKIGSYPFGSYLFLVIRAAAELEATEALPVRYPPYLEVLKERSCLLKSLEYLLCKQGVGKENIAKILDGYRHSLIGGFLPSKSPFDGIIQKQFWPSEGQRAVIEPVLRVALLRMQYQPNPIAILGPPGAGKSMLASLITSGVSDIQREPAYPPGAFYISYPQSGRILLSVSDLPGTREGYRRWREAVASARWIIYAVDASLLLRGEATAHGAVERDRYWDRIDDDAMQLECWFKEMDAHTQPSVLILGTHLDRLSRFPSAEDAAIWRARLEQHEVISSLIERLKLAGVAGERIAIEVGSLSTEGAAELEARILEYIWKG